MRKICLTLTGLLLLNTQSVIGADLITAQITADIRADMTAPSGNLNWWANETLTVEGRGFVLDDENDSTSGRVRAKRMAMMDGYRNLAEAAGKVQITSKDTLEKQKINALVKGAKVLSETYDEYGNCTVILSVPIYGVRDSFAKAAFNPVERKKFLSPTSKVTAEGKYTGLIVDCGNLELNPVLSPAIRSEKNRSIYGFSNLDYDKVLAKGMIGYAEKSLPNFGRDDGIILTGIRTLRTPVGSRYLFASADENFSRAGNNPLVINAAALSDDSTCPVISAEDADKILAENMATHFLEEGAVVFTSNRIRGMRM